MLTGSATLLFSDSIESTTSLITQIPIPETISESPEHAVNPEPTVQEKASDLALAQPDLINIEHSIKSGESLSVIFSKFNFSKKDLHNIVYQNKSGKLFSTIKPGKQIIFKVDSEGQLQQVKYQKNTRDTLIAERNDDHFNVVIVSKPIHRETAHAQMTIHSSLFLDGKKAGLSDKLMMELANIFAWDIDFAMDLRQGDHFTVVYEKLFVDSEEFGTGDIISAEFVNQGKAFTAVRFNDSKGNSNYYTPEGKSLRKAFLRSPVDFARVSSHFNLRRRHPVLNKIRAHKGVDYAASTGTPIKATGEGKITFRGSQRGYGRVVVVQHGQKYSTKYAHMSRFRKGQKKGHFVKQGDIIGYVGKSGLATGPHLHYEFLVNGVHRNPLKIKLPTDNPIDNKSLEMFKQQTQPLLAQLSKVKAQNLLAKNQQ